MVEEWNVGDIFEVISYHGTGYFKVGEKGICIEKPSKNAQYLYFAPNFSIAISRIKKVKSNKNYELW